MMPIISIRMDKKFWNDFKEFSKLTHESASEHVRELIQKAMQKEVKSDGRRKGI
jgi:Arc/MetJ-type ribon-helix-helix transcriptional regulator